MTVTTIVSVMNSLYYESTLGTYCSRKSIKLQFTKNTDQAVLSKQNRNKSWRNIDHGPTSITVLLLNMEEIAYADLGGILVFNNMNCCIHLIQLFMIFHATYRGNTVTSSVEWLVTELGSGEAEVPSVHFHVVPSVSRSCYALKLREHFNKHTHLISPSYSPLW
ncbi:hypothetical protein BDB01DRAFT_835342 [Pilobolus umbonatus]|nr:hypothetical protein BDB01DRAFT_835342 [Pilobolus umbonatus]